MGVLRDGNEWRSKASISATQRSVDDAVKRCHENGWRLTPIRRRAVELMCLSKHPVRAYELLHAIAGEQNVAQPMRIYRALEFLTKKHFVRHLKSINAFVWCTSPEEASDAPFFICSECGVAAPISAPDVTALLVKRAGEQGLQADPGTMEIHGLCGTCSGESRR